MLGLQARGYLLGAEELSPATFTWGCASAGVSQLKGMSLRVLNPYGCHPAGVQGCWAAWELLADATAPIWCCACQAGSYGH